MSNHRAAQIVQHFAGPVPEFAHVVVCMLDGNVTHEAIHGDLAQARDDLAEYVGDCENEAFGPEAARAEVGVEVRYDERCRFVIVLRRLDRLDDDQLADLVQLRGGPFAGYVLGLVA